MATKPKKCIGTVACLVCGSEIPARENENGTIDMGCGFCDFTAYAKRGTEAHQVISASINRKELPPAAAPVVVPEAAPAAPAPKVSPAKVAQSLTDILTAGFSRP